MQQQLTPNQLASVLNIGTRTLDMLISNESIPRTYINENTFTFDPGTIKSWLAKRQEQKSVNEQAYIEKLRREWHAQFPNTMKDIKSLDSKFSNLHIPKGYNLTKVRNKKLGFTYYVRYILNGKLVPTRWSTHTNDKTLAIQFALENKTKLLSRYLQDRNKRKLSSKLYTIMRDYYKKDSPYLLIDYSRGRRLVEGTRNVYNGFMNGIWIPYLREQGVTKLYEIDTPFIARFQNHMLRTGMKPPTINHHTGCLSALFNHLLTEGHIHTNPCKNLTQLKTREEDQEITGCYNTDKIAGVFNKKWKDELSYLLCLIIYTTGMRNSEIERIEVKDLITVNKLHFIDIPKSKTTNGVRIVPLHDFVYQHLLTYTRKNNMTPDSFIFKLPHKKILGSETYLNANNELAKHTGYTSDMLKKENIRFYSGRHFWKTLMNSQNLGEVEEYFMGHKVSSDVAKLYNHRDKQGKDQIAKKAQKVFATLDRYVFTKPQPKPRGKQVHTQETFVYMKGIRTH